MLRLTVKTTLADLMPPDAVLAQAGARGIRNLMGERRLDLIVKTNVEQARGWAQFMEGTTPAALLAFPAQRLVRVRQRRMPRDWTARWKEAGDAVGWQGACRDEFVALKLSPIWAALSRFGTPYPPFDFNSGMGVEDVCRRKARELGLLKEESGDSGKSGESGSRAAATPETPSFNASLKADVPWANDEDWRKMKEAFGDQVRRDGDTVKWRSSSSARSRACGRSTKKALGPSPKPGAGLPASSMVARAARPEHPQYSKKDST